MIRIWHDDAMRWLPLWLTVTMLNTSVLLGIVLWRQATGSEDLQPPTGWLLIILWSAIAFYIVFGHVRTRCQRLEMTLPISSTALWRRHFGAVFLAGATVLGGSLGVLALHAGMMSKAGRLRFVTIPYFSLVGPLLAGLLLAAALVNSVEPGLQKLRGRGSYWALVLGSLAGIALLLLLLEPWPWASTGICLALAIVVSHQTQRALPAAFRLVPTAASTDSADRAVAASTDQAGNRWQVYRTLFNILHTAPPWKQFTPWLVHGFGALMGFVLAGGIDRWKEAADMRFLYLPFGCYMLFAGTGILTYNLFRLDSLPVSRRTILTVLLLPGLIAYSAGYAAGWWARTTAPNPSPLVDFHVREAHVEIDPRAGDGTKTTEVRTMVWVEVDSSFMGIQWTGVPPMLTSPWGETHEAWHEEVFRGSSTLYFNPYNTTEDTSPEFEALMLSRAIEDVYGQTISPEVLQESYFVVENNRVVALKPELRRIGPDSRVVRPREGLPLLEDYPELQAPPKGPETAVYLLLVLGPWFLLTAFFIHFFKATRSNRFIRGVYWAGLAIPMLGMLSNVLLSVFGLFSPAAGRGSLEIMIRSLGTSPSSWAATWLACLAAIGASYFLALRRFERAEIPTSAINCSLVDWGQED